jgi:RNA polymerase sigma factor (sigma-70 family)
MVNDDIAQMSEGLASPAAAQAGPRPSPNGDLMTVVARYQGALLRYVGRMLGAMGDQSEDVVQETFIRLHRQVSMQGWDSIKHPTTWLFQVAHNLTLDVLRQRKRRPGRVEPDAQRPFGPGLPSDRGHELAPAQAGDARDTVAAQEMDALGEAIRQEARHAVLRELAQLEEVYRQVILLKIIQGMSLRQAAEVVGVSLTTVNSRLNQGLSILAQRLRRAGVV